MTALGRVEMWRGICRSDISVSVPFVWRCLSGPSMAPFPHPAHRTGRADFPHPACMGLSLSRYHAIFVFLCHSILLFDPRRRAFFSAAEGSSLTDASTAAGCRRRVVGRARIRGEPAIGRDQTRTTLVFG